MIEPTSEPNLGDLIDQLWRAGQRRGRSTDMSTGDHTPRDAPAPPGAAARLRDLARLGLAYVRLQRISEQTREPAHRREAIDARARLERACKAALGAGQGELFDQAGGAGA